MSKVSVVIPCYNQGRFLNEAVDSVLQQTYNDIEIIVVNDGSTDEYTIRMLNDYDREKTTVVSTANQGLAAARNNGIVKSSGEYILPLDADDKIGSGYVEKAVEALDAYQDAGIVYCGAMSFGAVEGKWGLPDYSLKEMIRDNIIFCTALFRRSDWELVGGYDPAMKYGWEDYDFWLSLIERGREVIQLDDIFFYYRVAQDSMVRSKEKWQKVEMFKRIYQKHSALIGENIEIWLDDLVESKEKHYLSKLYVDCGEEFNEQDTTTCKVDEGTSRINFDVSRFEGRKGVRFDPVDCPVCITIDSIELLGEQHSIRLDIDDILSNATCIEDQQMMFATDDPLIFLVLDDPELGEVDKIAVSLSYDCFGEDALNRIVDYQQKLIAKFLAGGDGL